jgi:hypothetical protein
MYLGACRTCRTKLSRISGRRMSGLGFDPFSLIAPVAGAIFGGGGGGGGSSAPGMAPVPVTVSPTISPTIQTAISPQISPVFQQSYMPQNSAMTAGTAQTMPTSQSAPGGLPQPGTAGGYAPGAMPFPSDSGAGLPQFPGLDNLSPLQASMFPSGSGAQSWLPWAMIGGAVFLILLSMKKKRAVGGESDVS